MPWTADQAEEHTHKADTPELRKLWAEVANDRLRRGNSEAASIRQANAVVARQKDGETFGQNRPHRWV